MKAAKSPRRPADSTLVSLSVSVYRLLLTLYPSRFREQHGPQMVQVVRDLCRRDLGRGGALGVLGLWTRLLVDLLGTAVDQHTERGVRIPAESFGAPMRRASWRPLALASLMGMYAVGTALFGEGPTKYVAPSPQYLDEIAIGLAAAGVLLRFPVWSLVPLGWVLGMLSRTAFVASITVTLLLPAIGWVAHRLGWRIPRLFWGLYGAIGVVGLIRAFAANLAYPPGSDMGIPTGLRELVMMADGLTFLLTGLVLPLLLVVALLARRHGSAAALAIVGAALFPYIEIDQPDYFLHMLDPDRARIVTLAMYAPLLLCPLGVLWARSALARRAAILVPWAAALAVGAVLPEFIRTPVSTDGWNVALWIGVEALAVAMQFFLVVLMAVLWYERVAPTPAPADAPDALPQVADSELPRLQLSSQVSQT